MGGRLTCSPAVAERPALPQSHDQKRIPICHLSSVFFRAYGEDDRRL
jgi:hypothetical protein